MIVVLDTSVFAKNYFMQGRGFEVLFDFIDKTGSRIILPKVVQEELRANHRRELEGSLEKANAGLEAVNACLLSPEILLSRDVDVDAESANYMKYARGRLRVPPGVLSEYRLDDLSQAIERAIWRCKPCRDRGTQVRDAAIWCAVKRIAREHSEEETVFISRNTHDFGGEPGQLHPDLQAEIRDEGLKLTFFESLDDFARKHAEPIAFISTDWIAEQIDMQSVFRRTVSILQDEASRRVKHREHGDVLFDRDQASVPGQIAMRECYVYRMKDDSLRVEAVARGEAQLDVWIGAPVIEREWDFLLKSGATDVKTKEPSDRHIALWHERVPSPFKHRAHVSLEVKLDVLVDGTTQKLQEWEIAEVHVRMPLDVMRWAHN